METVPGTVSIDFSLVSGYNGGKYEKGDISMKRSLKICLIAISLVIMAIFIACIPNSIDGLQNAKYILMNYDRNAAIYKACIQRILSLTSNFLGIALCGMCIVGVLFSERITIRLYHSSEAIKEREKIDEERKKEKIRIDKERKILKLTEKQQKIQAQLNSAKEDRE